MTQSNMLFRLEKKYPFLFSNPQTSDKIKDFLAKLEEIQHSLNEINLANVLLIHGPINVEELVLMYGFSWNELFSVQSLIKYLITEITPNNSFDIYSLILDWSLAFKQEDLIIDLIPKINEKLHTKILQLAIENSKIELMQTVFQHSGGNSTDLLLQCIHLLSANIELDYHNNNLSFITDSKISSFIDYLKTLAPKFDKSIIEFKQSQLLQTLEEQIQVYIPFTTSNLEGFKVIVKTWEELIIPISFFGQLNFLAPCFPINYNALGAKIIVSQLPKNTLDELLLLIDILLESQSIPEGTQRKILIEILYEVNDEPLFNSIQDYLNKSSFEEYITPHTILTAAIRKQNLPLLNFILNQKQIKAGDNFTYWQFDKSAILSFCVTQKRLAVSQILHCLALNCELNESTIKVFLEKYPNEAIESFISLMEKGISFNFPAITSAVSCASYEQVNVICSLTTVENRIALLSSKDPTAKQIACNHLKAEDLQEEHIQQLSFESLINLCQIFKNEFLFNAVLDKALKNQGAVNNPNLPQLSIDESLIYLRLDRLIEPLLKRIEEPLFQDRHTLELQLLVTLLNNIPYLNVIKNYLSRHRHDLNALPIYPHLIKLFVGNLNTFEFLGEYFSIATITEYIRQSELQCLNIVDLVNYYKQNDTNKLIIEAIVDRARRNPGEGTTHLMTLKNLNIDKKLLAFNFDEVIEQLTNDFVLMDVNELAAYCQKLLSEVALLEALLEERPPFPHNLTALYKAIIKNHLDRYGDYLSLERKLQKPNCDETSLKIMMSLIKTSPRAPVIKSAMKNRPQIPSQNPDLMEESDLSINNTNKNDVSGEPSLQNSLHLLFFEIPSKEPIESTWKKLISGCTII